MKRQISLLPKEEFGQRPLGKLLIWALSVGRWIVVLTEFIVICAFLSRFYLDRRIADLSEEISQKRAIVVSMAGFEKEFRLVGERLETVKKITAMRGQEKVFDLVAPLAPADVMLTSLNLEKDTIKISALSLSQVGLNSFLANISASPHFSGINITRIAKEEGEIGIRINFSAQLKTEGENNAI